MNVWTDAGPFTVAEVADAARCSPGFVRKAIANGALRAAHAGRALRIPRSEARRWAAELGAEAPGAEISRMSRTLAHVAHGGK